VEFLSSFLSQVTIYTVIYTLAALGIIVSGRTGVFNVAAEGIMLASASFGFIAANLTGSWLIGFAAGAGMGLIFGLFLAFVHETFKVNQFILGITLVILGSGVSDLLYKVVMGVRLEAPRAPATPILNVPLLGDLPVLSAFFKQNAIVFFMYAACAAVWWFLYRTRAGLETRAIGENPRAADVVGVNVTARRYLATMLGSLIIGVAGAYIPLVITETYSPGIAAGRGFMAVGIAIFASWKPGRAMLGGFIFSAIEVLAFQLQILSDKIPYQFFLMLPFISVLVVMMVFRKHIEFPASVGKPYSRE
jgi:general nucleoside transport system permease protein